MKTFVVVLVLLALGVGLAWVGYNQTQSQEVTCSGVAMSPGDLCEYSDGTLNSYEEEKASQQSSGWIGVGIGAVVAVLGMFVLVSGVTRRGRQAATG
jgi:hypothetical protein